MDGNNEEGVLEVKKKLFQLSLPIFVEGMMDTIMGSIDTIMLSSYSDDAVAAVSMANQILFLIQVLACIVTTGTSILCAQYIGAKKSEEEQNDLIAASILMNVGMGVILTILMSLFYPIILNFLHLSGLVRNYAGEYLNVINCFLWVQLISAVFSAVLRSYGKTKQCMYVSVGINACNIVLNYLLIFGKLGFPAMGIRGAAIATVSGRFLGFLMLMWILFDMRRKQSKWKICWKKIVQNMLRVITYGIPAAGEQISYNLAQFFVMFFVTMIGMKAVAAQSYLHTCVRFIYIFSMSLGEGTAIMVGWSAGAREYEKADKACRFAGKCAFIFSMVMMTGMFVFRNQMFSLFTSDSEIAGLAGTVLLANFLLETGRSQNLVYANSLRAVGDVKFPFYIGLVFMWGIAVGGSYFLGIVLDMGLFGVWIAQGLDECFRAVGMGIRWRKKALYRFGICHSVDP